MKHPETPLSAIIAACCKGDEAAQLVLYKRYYAYALTVSLHYCRDRTEAEEVVQDAFVKVFRGLSSFDGTQDLKPWLRTIVVRTAINHFRAGLKLPSNADIEALGLHPVVENRALEQLQEEDIYRLLQLLPPAYRLVFNLYVLEGYTHPEIAEILQISVGSSKSNLAKARRKLQQLSEPFLLLLLNSAIYP